MLTTVHEVATTTTSQPVLITSMQSSQSIRSFLSDGSVPRAGARTPQTRGMLCTPSHRLDGPFRQKSWPNERTSWTPSWANPLSPATKSTTQTGEEER